MRDLVPNRTILGMVDDCFVVEFAAESGIFGSNRIGHDRQGEKHLTCRGMGSRDPFIYRWSPPQGSDRD